VIQSGDETPPNLAIALNKRGNAYLDKGQYDRARYRLRRCADRLARWGVCLVWPNAACGRVDALLAPDFVQARDEAV
jgi:hypothetical protein